MAETFLHDLLQSSNIVQSDVQDDQDCIICLQRTGTLSRETGVIECQLRLPCNHTVGSVCIVKWLQDNNTCPLCRQKFFPAQPRPYMEHPILESQVDEVEEHNDEEERRQHNERLSYIGDACRDCCQELQLNNMAVHLSIGVAFRILKLEPTDQDATFNDYKVHIVSVAMYLASWVVRKQRSPREICAVVNSKLVEPLGQDSIDGDQIRMHLTSLYNTREQFANDEARDFFQTWDELWSLSILCESDDVIEFNRDRNVTLNLCKKYGGRLGLTGSIQSLSEKIVPKIVATGFHLLSSPPSSEYLYPEQIVAVSIYIASHLGGQPVSSGVIGDLIGGNFPDIRATCRLVRKTCNEIIGRNFWKSLNVQLDWETLEYADFLWVNG